MASAPMSRDSTSGPPPSSAAQWRDTLLDRIRQAASADERVSVMELCRNAVEQEPGDTRLWRLYADWVWLLYKISHKVQNVYPSCTLEHEQISQEWAEDDNLIGQAVFQWGRVMDVWQDAVNATQWHLNDSHLVWDPYLELLLYDLAQNHSPDKVSAVNKAIVDRLYHPHATWDDTFQAYSRFVTAHNEANYEQVMMDVRAKTAKARGEYDARQMKEQAVDKAVRNGDEEAEVLAYQDYLTWEEGQTRRKKGAPSYARALFTSLCERATSRFPLQSDFWADYVVFLMQMPLKAGPLLSVAERATAHCPGSGDLWQLRLYAAEACEKTFDEVHLVKHAATAPGKLQESGRMEEQIKVDYAWCSYLRRRAFRHGAVEDDRDVAEMAIRSSIDEMMADGTKIYGKNFKGDPQFRLERVYLKFMAQCGRLSEGRTLFKHLEKTYGDGSYFWERWYLWEMTVYGSPFDLEVQASFEPLYNPSSATAVLEQALKRTNLDWPEKLVEMYIHHCGQHESIHKLLEAIVETRRITKHVAKLREQQAADAAQHYPYGAQPTENSTAEPAEIETSEQVPKRKREDGQNEDTPAKRARNDEGQRAQTQEAPANESSSTQTAQVKRDRENTTMIVKHLPSSATSDAVRSFFRSCGDINAINVIPDAHNEDEATATIEFATAEDVLTAQTKDKKLFEGKEIDVQVGTGTTLFVTNYPATADEKWVRELFDPHGEVVEVRFPSLKYDARRRFCYVQFLTGTQARAASEALDGKPLAGKLELVAKISNPKIKKEKTGPAHEGRELYVGNVNWTAEEKDVEELFKPFGTVEHVRMPRRMDGKSKAVAFVVFKTKEDAERGLAMNLKEFRSRLLKVEISGTHTAGPARHGTATTLIRGASSASPAPSEDTPMSGVPDHASPGQSSGASQPSVNHKERTLVMLNIPDTVNSERIRALCEQYGPLKKVQLRSDHAGALVEFESVGDMGRASMALEGHDIDGSKLRIGSNAKELFASQPKQKSSGVKGSGMLMARPINRPAQGGRRGGRGGLGFRGGSTRREAEEASSKDGVAAAATPAQGKTQADFRALLTGSKPSNASNGNGNGNANGAEGSNVNGKG